MRSIRSLAPAVAAAMAFAAQAAHAAPDYIPGEALIQYVPGTSESTRALARARAHAAKLDDVAEDLELVRLPPGLDVADAVARLHGDASVDFAEPNFIYQHQATASDPYYTNGSLWGMYGNAT